MVVITGYEILEQIYESCNSAVYRGRREEDNRMVILKVLKPDCLNPVELNRYKHEYEIICNFQHPGIIKAFDLQQNNSSVMVLEDFGGESLKNLLSQRKFNLVECLEIACQITDSLAQIHAELVIHRDISSSNIVFNPVTKQLKIIDFGISTKLKSEHTVSSSPNAIDGTLAYISPEETQSIDFYSLGITLYELFTHQLPSRNDDAIAKQSLHEISRKIPRMVSAIVIKLMATAEERYQSGWTIKADLETCLHQLQNYNCIIDFDLGKQDSYQFKTSQKHLFNLVFEGVSVSELIAKVNNSLLFFGQKQAANDIWAVKLCLLNLNGETEELLNFNSPELSEAEFLQSCWDNKSYMSLFNYYSFKSFILYLYNQPVEALETVIEAEKLVEYVVGITNIAEQNFYQSLILTALYPAATFIEQKQYWQKLEINQKQMKIWSDNCEANFLHKYLVIEAEIARISGNKLEAMELYDLAIAAANTHGFIHHQALINELAAKFWLGMNKEDFAQIYLHEAYKSYRTWGAKYKVADCLGQLSMNNEQLSYLI